MLAKAADTIPSDDGWLFEPKWDGFRALVFRDGDEVYTQSRDLKPLDRYFPELADPLRAALPDRCVLDGEVVIARDGALDFEALLLRIHPAASRVKMLAAESPASFVAWDLLALGDEDLRQTPQGDRRARLESVLGSAEPPIHLTPATRDRATAAGLVRAVRGRRPRWRRRQAARCAHTSRASGRCSRSSISAPRTALSPGSAGTRTGRARTSGRCCSGCTTTPASSTTPGSPRRSRGTAEPSWPRSSPRCASTPSTDHPWREWAEWAGYGDAEASGQRLPGATSRWNRGKDLSWEPLRPERVAEVAYDHLQGSRFRHATTFKRWRPDKPPEACRYDQLEETAPFLLAHIFGGDA